MRYVIFIMLGFGLVGCGAGFKAARYCAGTMQKRQVLPLVLSVDDSVDSAGFTALVDAGSAMEKQTGLQLFQYQRVRGFGGVRKDGFNLIAFFRSWAWAPGIQGQTTNWYYDDRLTESDIYVNLVNFTFFTGSTPVWNRVHLESLFIHELGHSLGLEHVDVVDSIMSPYLSYGEVRMTMAPEDVAALRCLYAE
jgi:hypothetical protein